MDALISRVLEKAIVVEEAPHHFNYLRDPKDEKYINVAVEAEASYIVSHDQDLLDLMTGHTGECKDFRRRFRSLKIIEPAEFLKTIVIEKERSERS